jgi:hypothetical protein
VTYYLFLPGLLTVAIGLAVHSMLGARTATSLGRIGALALGAQTLVVASVVAIALAWLDQPVEDRCGGTSDGYGRLVLAAIFGAAAIGGVVFASAIADRRRQSATLVWHVVAIPLAVLLPYVAGFAAVVVAFSCLS